jgi:2-oxoglutarate ferredoxin oxidoreductase subunit beta
MVEVLNKTGFCFIEILAPCPTLCQRRNPLGDGLDTMKYYKQKSVIKNGIGTKDVNLNLQGNVTIGKFLDIERPPLKQVMDPQFQRAVGSRYAGPGGL